MSSYRYTVERDSLRERERQARAQMSQQASEIQEAQPVFKPPVRVNPAATDRVTQQIQSKLGDYRYVKHFLDDPTSSIGVYGEPASPAPGVPQRGVEFKKPHHASSQNGRPHHRMPHPYGKMSEGAAPLSLHTRPAPPHFPHNGKTPPNVGEPNGVPPIDHILKEMKSVSMTPLTAIAATPRKETESKFNFNMGQLQKINDNISQSNGPSEAKPAPLPKQHLDRHSNTQLSSADDLLGDLCLTDSEDEARKRKSSSVMASPPPAGSTSGSESSSSDSDSDSSSDDSKPPVAVSDEPPQVVEGPGEAACSQQQRPSWSLSNFAPQPARPPQPAAAAESDSCYDSTKEVESVLAAAKGKTETLLSSLSNSDDSSDERGAKNMRLIRSSSAVGSSSERSRTGRSRPAPPPSSPSEDDSPPPRKPRGRPRTKPARTVEEDIVKKRRGRPPKVKQPAPPRPTSSSSDDERRPPSPPSHSPPRRWHTTDSEGEDCSIVTTDKEKNDTLKRLFCPVGGAKGGGKGGAKGGKGKGQVVVIEAHSLEHEKEDDSLQKRLKEEEAYKRQREEEAQRRLKEEEAIRRKLEEEKEQRRLKEEANQRRIKEEEAVQRRLKDEEMRRKLKEEEALQRKLKEEEALQRRKEEEAQRRLKEEEAAQRREEAIQRRIRENELTQRRLKEEELLQRKIKEEELSHRRFKEEDSMQRRLKEESVKPVKEEDPLQRRIREDSTRIRSSKGEDMVVTGEEVGVVGPLMVRLDLSRLSSSFVARLRRGKRPPPLPPAPPDKKPKLTVRQNPETTPTNHERVETEVARPGGQPLVYYSYLERGHQDCSSDEESRDHKYYLLEAKRLRAAAELEGDLLGRVMLYQESVLCFVLTGRVLELELDTKKAFTMYRETMEYIKSIHSMPARHRASPQSTLSKLDILSMRCQALLYLRMFKMYKGEVKEYYKIFQEYLQKPACPEAVGTVSPLSPTPSPAGSVGSVGSAGSSGYSSAAPALTPQHLGSIAAAAGASAAPVMLAVPQQAHQAMVCLTKYYGFLHISHDLWEQADQLIRIHRYTDLFISVDRACGPLTLHSSFRHLVKYVRHAISILKAQSRHGS